MRDPSRKTPALSQRVRELYPFQGRFLSLPNGHRLHYLDEGAGETLLMLHGNPTWSFYYRDLVRGLSGTRRCVVPDHLGCGLSDKPAAWGYRITDHVDNVVRLVDELDLRDVTLVVHDWGGAIGYLAALRRPDRFRRFVVFNSAAFLLPLPAILRAFRLPLYGPVVVRALNGFLLGGLLLMPAKRERFRGAVREGYLAPYGSWDERVAVLRFVQEIPIEKDHPNRRLLRELEDGLGLLRDRPHLIVWGAKDFVFHRGYLEEWRRQFPAAEVHVFDDASHWVVEEAHERILPLVREFLDRHPLSGS